jgi:hypothetical protein
VLATPSIGVPNWSVIYINTAPSTSFLAPLLGIYEEEAPTSTWHHQTAISDANLYEFWWHK